MRVRAIVIGVVLVLLASSSAHGQSAKVPTKTPAALARIPFPGCPSADCQFTNEHDVAGFLADSFLFSHVPGGFSELPGQRAEDLNRYDFRPARGRLLDLLNSIVLAEPRYRWEIRDDVINMVPIHDYPFLDTVIADFSPEDSTAREMIVALERSVDFKRGLALFRLRGREYSARDTIPRRSARFSVRFKNATVRQILNGIVRQDGSAVWHYHEGWGQCDLSLMID